MRSSAQSLAPQHVSGALGVQVRVNPELADSAKSAPFRSRRARAVLELCHGDPWLSGPFRRRGAHVVPSRDLNATLLAQKGLAVLNLIFSGRIWYLHVDWGVYNWSSKSVASLLRIVSACSRHLVLVTLKLSVSRASRLLNRVLSVFRPPAPFSHLKSGSQAVGEVASARHMFTNSNRLIALNRKAFKRQNQFQIRLPSFSVAYWIRLISKEMPLTGSCSCAPRDRVACKATRDFLPALPTQ